MFGASPQTAQGSVPSLLCAAAALPFWGVVRLFSSYFYASGRHRESLLLIFGDPLCLSPLFLYLLPVRFGVNGIWAAFPRGAGRPGCGAGRPAGVGAFHTGGLYPLCQDAGASAKISPIAPVRTSVALLSAGVGVLFTTTSSRPA